MERRVSASRLQGEARAQGGSVVPPERPPPRPVLSKPGRSLPGWTGPSSLCSFLSAPCHVLRLPADAEPVLVALASPVLGPRPRHCSALWLGLDGLICKPWLAGWGGIASRSSFPPPSRHIPHPGALSLSCPVGSSANCDHPAGPEGLSCPLQAPRSEYSLGTGGSERHPT